MSASAELVNPESPNSPQGPPKRKVLASAVLKCAVVGGLFGIGYWIGIPPEAPTKIDTTAEHSAPEALLEQVKQPGDDTDWKRGDELFKEGRFDLALRAYHAAPEANPSLRFRTALCLEELGHFDKAIACYQAVARGGSAVECALSQLGVARVQIRRLHPTDARSLILPLVQESQNMSPTMSAEAHYLLALAWAQEAVPRAGPLDLADDVRTIADLQWSLSRQMEWLDLAAQDTKKPEEDILEVSDSTQRSNVVVLQCVAKSAPAFAVIEHLAKSGNWSVAWSTRALELIETRSMSIAIENRPLLSVLQNAAECFGLICQVQGDRLALTAASDMDPALLAKYRNEQARRTLQEAVVYYPAHALTPAAYLCLGRLESVEDRAESLASYERLLQEFPRSRLAVDAHFQRGILLGEAGKSNEARKAFYQVVDHDPGHPLASRSLLLIGRSYMEDGDFKQAVSSLRQCEESTSEQGVRSQAVLARAAALTLGNDPRAAGALLATHRQLLQAPLYRPTAQFLTVFARFRTALLTKQPHANEDSELLALLLPTAPASTLGIMDAILRGLAFFDLSLWQQAAETYERAVGEARGAVKDEVTYRWADACEHARQGERARQLWNSIADHDGPWKDMAQFKLAALDLDENRTASAIGRCRALLDNLTAVENGDVLTLMGRALERQGRYEDAATCFAGHLPNLP